VKKKESPSDRRSKTLRFRGRKKGGAREGCLQSTLPGVPEKKGEESFSQIPGEYFHLYSGAPEDSYFTQKGEKKGRRGESADSSPKKNVFSLG